MRTRNWYWSLLCLGIMLLLVVPGVDILRRHLHWEEAGDALYWSLAGLLIVLGALLGVVAAHLFRDQGG